jgi:hypothetical protein
VLAFANVENLLGGNIHIINKNTETLIDSIKKVGLEVNAKKTKYIFIMGECILLHVCVCYIYEIYIYLIYVAIKHV